MALNEVIPGIPAHLVPRWRGYLEKLGLRTWTLESPPRVAMRHFAARIDAVPALGRTTWERSRVRPEQLLDE